MKNRLLTVIIVVLLLASGCKAKGDITSVSDSILYNDITVSENDAELTEDSESVNVESDSVSSDDLFSILLLCDSEEYKVEYDEANQKFILVEKINNSKSEVECPYFWGNDGINQIESDEYKNINFEKETGILEVSIGNYTDGYVSFYLQISDGNNISCEEIEHYTYRYLNGKGIFVDEELTEEIFDEKVSSVLRRYGMDENPEEFITYSEHFPEAFIELYYNPLNDIYYVFFTEEYINTEGFVFCYSLCPLEKAPEEFLIEDPYKFEANDGTTGEEYVDDLIEDIVYDGNNIVSTHIA